MAKKKAGALGYNNISRLTELFNDPSIFGLDYALSKGTWRQVNENGFGQGSINIEFPCSFKGNLYFGTELFESGNYTDVELWRFNGESFSKIWERATTNAYIGIIREWKNCLYFGISSDSVCQIWRSNDSESWEQLSPSWDSSNIECQFITPFLDKLYFGLGKSSGGCEVWSFDGQNWLQVNVDGFGDENNVICYAGIVFNGKLYVGTYNIATNKDPQIWAFDGANWVKSWSAIDAGLANGLFIFDSEIFKNKLYMVLTLEDWSSKIMVLDGSWTIIRDSSLAISEIKTSLDGGSLYISASDWGGTNQITVFDGSVFTNIPIPVGMAQSVDAAIQYWAAYGGKEYLTVYDDIVGAGVWEYDPCYY